jgi:hypothetical protein
MRATQHDATHDEHEQFERRLCATDRDIERVDTTDLDERTARELVSDLMDTGTVVAVPEQRVLVHEPSGQAFSSTTQLAVFHRGWVTGRQCQPEGRSVEVVLAGWELLSSSCLWTGRCVTWFLAVHRAREAVRDPCFGKYWLGSVSQSNSLSMKTVHTEGACVRNVL